MEAPPSGFMSCLVSGCLAVGAMVTCLLIGVTWALLFVPQDYQQGLTNRIFYVHVPVASISLAFFPLMAMAGTIFLVWRMKLADVVVRWHRSVLGSPRWRWRPDPSGEWTPGEPGGSGTGD